MTILVATHSEMPGRRIEFDFVRGIAILAVMAFHFHVVKTKNPVFDILEISVKGFGVEGVNLFFTLSGFLVGGLLLKQLAYQGTINIGQFLIRRIFKIWPAYYALIIFHVIANRHPTSSFLIQNTLHLQNYLGSSIAQTWSLAIEEHFYLLLSAVLFIFVWLKLSYNGIIKTLWVICGFVLVARCITVSAGNLHAASQFTQYRIDSLLFGVILAAVYWFKPNVYADIAKRSVVLSLTAVATIIWIVAVRGHPVAGESIGYTIQAIGFCAIIVLVTEHSGRIKANIVYRAIAWLGIYSYGIYLWHSLALAPGDIIIRWCTSFGLRSEFIWIVAFLSQLAIAITLGYVTTRVIEFPFLHLRNLLFPAKIKSPRPFLLGSTGIAVGEIGSPTTTDPI